MAKVRACWFSCWLFPRNALQEKKGWNTCRKEILLRRPLSGILFFMTWFALFSFLVLCLLRFVVLQMKSKMLLIVYWITGNVAAHPIQCEIMLTTWLNSSAVPLLCPTRPRNSHISTDLCIYICMLVCHATWLCRFGSKSRTLHLALAVSKESSTYALSTCAWSLTLIDCISIV